MALPIRASEPHSRYACVLGSEVPVPITPGKEELDPDRETLKERQATP
jgi:hypothetical protein